MSIAVVVPVFRNEATIVRCLDSIRDATAGTQVELHVVLDGEQPDARAVLQTWSSGPSVELTIHVKNHSGIAGTRNHGLALVRSDRVTFLDADDEMTVQRMSAECEASPVFGLQELVLDAGTTLPPGTRAGRTPYLMSMVAPTQLLRDAGGFRESFTRGDDLDLHIRLQENGTPVRLVDSVFVRRHVHESNASWDAAAVRHDYVSAVREHLIRARRGHAE